MSTGLPITVYKNADFSYPIAITITNQNGTVTTPNISGDSFVGAIINDFTDMTVLANFTFTINNGAGGLVTMSIPKSVTATLVPPLKSTALQRENQLGVYSVEWTSETLGMTLRLVEGTVTFSNSANP